MSMDTVGISVVIPSYNAENTIEKSICSVLGQTIKNWELILVDDCSADNTVEIMRKYKKQDSRIRILRNKENRGVSFCRNLGVRNARYPWIAFLDADDSWEYEKLEKQMMVLQKYPNVSICFTGSAFIDENEKKSSYILKVPTKITRKELLRQNLISCSSVVVKRTSLLRHPMPEIRGIHEDYAVWLSILNEEAYAIGINKPLLIYRISASSKSGNKLRAAKMQWRTYRYAKIPYPAAIFAWLQYAYRSLRKYRGILRDING